MPGPVHLLKSLAWHCAHPLDAAIMRCTSLCTDPPQISAERLLRVDASDAQGRALAVATMQRAGEPAEEVGDRFAEGHVFFAWMIGDEVASFCWVTTRGRREIGAWIDAAEHRAVVYNVFTLEPHRGKSVATRLLLNVEQALAREGIHDLVASASLANKPSVGALTAAGFHKVAISSCVILFRRIRIRSRMRICDPSAATLFALRGQPVGTTGP